MVYDKASLQRRCSLIKLASETITTSTQNTNDCSLYKVLHFVNNGSSKHTDIKFYRKDCITGIQAYLQDKSVDVVVTSPPYNIDVDYDGVYNDNKPESEYIEWIERAGVEIKRVLKDKGSFFLNIGDELSNPGKAWAIAFALKKHFDIQNVIHWIKSINIKKSDVGATTAQKMILDDITPGHFKPIHSNRYFILPNQEVMLN